MLHLTTHVPIFIKNNYAVRKPDPQGKLLPRACFSVDLLKTNRNPVIEQFI